MKELLAALAAFGTNPEAVGDNLFTFFATIMNMKWEEATAAGFAIRALTDEAWNKAKAAEIEEFGALKDPTFMRLKSCLKAPIARVGQLIAEAPKERQGVLLESVSGKNGFVDYDSTKKWKEKLGLETAS